MEGNYLLSEVENQGGTWTKLGQLLRRYVFPTVDAVARQAGVSSTGTHEPPDPPESVSVSTSGELMQVVVNHSAPLNSRNARYFTTIATNPSGLNGMIHDHGASRTPPPFNLPTQDASGATHNYYVASQVQYPGGPPSKPTFFGGGQPVAVNMGGTTQMDLTPGTGSGTAVNGAQAFQGMGKSPIRR